MKHFILNSLFALSKGNLFLPLNKSVNNFIYYIHGKFVLTLFLLSMPYLMYSQGNSTNSIIDEISESELLLTPSQSNKLNFLKSKPQYKNISAVKIGNIQSFQNRGGLFRLKFPA